MARFCGEIGFVIDVENPPSVWKEVTIDRLYYGDILKVTNKWDNGSGINDDFNIRNRVSILADDFAYDNLYAMRYVTIAGKKWKILDADLQRPRIILSIGGIYHAQVE